MNFGRVCYTVLCGRDRPLTPLKILLRSRPDSHKTLDTFVSAIANLTLRGGAEGGSDDGSFDEFWNRPVAIVYRNLRLVNQALNLAHVGHGIILLRFFDLTQPIWFCRKYTGDMTIN